ncbi:uncharacterized protein DNG_04762 [Cephalotrichum gorgonifer]|uniref:AB hydrolase-1 domain-containing protein n=1 Tax=Cephalotrichum gorgonifer TaxID=2041049 RepID=A0AAE8MYH8_9PEZI|nr:uncharacterized protein DNG_04762 [Cephalotrichum gorgonifer]
MADPFTTLLIVIGAGLAAVFGFYVALFALAAIPSIQKHLLYVHKANTLLWDDVNKPEKWGFARNQVTPFKLATPDGESIYAWHILPLPLYAKHEESISSSREPGLCEDVERTKPFHLLKEDPNAKVIIFLHGNAGHIAQGWRADTYHTFTDTTSYHGIAIDYRGFGHSTGTPSEKGLILDAMTVVDWVINVAGVPPERIVLFGQSLGTAVASGVAEACVDDGIELAGVVLVAGFSSLPAMLSGYRISGLVPILGPLRWVPFMPQILDAFVCEKWSSADRLARTVQRTKSRLRLSLVHAKNDKDIPCIESDRLFNAAAIASIQAEPDISEFEVRKKEATRDRGEGAFMRKWTAEPNTIICHEQFSHGGHNQIMGHAPALLAVLRSFEEDR